MDFTRLTQGEKIAGISGVALILIMFIFSWYGVELAGESVPDSDANAWEAFGFIDIVLFITVAAAIGLALISASQTASSGRPSTSTLCASSASGSG
jgi:hypothetical protein